MAGHIWSVFLNFNGGKGIATTAGRRLAVNHPPRGLARFGWLLVLLLTRYISVLAGAGAGCFRLCAWLFGHWPEYVICGVIDRLLVFRGTAPTSKRLRAGTEYRFGETGRGEGRSTMKGQRNRRRGRRRVGDRARAPAGPRRPEGDVFGPATPPRPRACRRTASTSLLARPSAAGDSRCHLPIGRGSQDEAIILAVPSQAVASLWTQLAPWIRTRTHRPQRCQRALKSPRRSRSRKCCWRPHPPLSRSGLRSSPVPITREEVAAGLPTASVVAVQRFGYGRRLAKSFDGTVVSGSYTSDDF